MTDDIATDRPTCECSKCGRIHWKLANSPPPGAGLSIEKKPIFCVMPIEGQKPLLALGLTRASFEDMLDTERSRTLDLSSIGLPVRILIFSAETHDAAMKILQDAAAKLGIPLLDERRRNFSMKEDGDAAMPGKENPER